MGGSKKSLSIIRIGCWNVRSLNITGKLENLKKEMERLKMDIVGISEVKWKEDNDFWSGGYRVINTGKENGVTELDS